MPGAKLMHALLCFALVTACHRSGAEKVAVAQHPCARAYDTDRSAESVEETLPDRTPVPVGGTIVVCDSTVGLSSTFVYGVDVDSGVTSGLFAVGRAFTTFGVPEGKHVVRLTNLPAECSAADHPRSIRVAGTDTVDVRFVVMCHGS